MKYNFLLMFIALRGWDIRFRVLTFVNPECDNVLQPEPRSGGDCNTLSHSGLSRR